MFFPSCLLMLQYTVTVYERFYNTGSLSNRGHTGSCQAPASELQRFSGFLLLEYTALVHKGLYTTGCLHTGSSLAPASGLLLL